MSFEEAMAIANREQAERDLARRQERERMNRALVEVFVDDQVKAANDQVQIGVQRTQTMNDVASRPRIRTVPLMNGSSWSSCKNSTIPFFSSIRFGCCG